MVLWDYINSLWRAPRCDSSGRIEAVIEKGSITLTQASGATIVTKHGEVNNSIVTLHTVTAGKTFHLGHWTMGLSYDGVNADRLYFYVTNAADAEQYIIFDLTSSVAYKMTESGCFPVPLPIVAGWKVKIRSVQTGSYMRCFIYGYEI